ncbi:MAG: hypothetical protein ABR506_08230 [Candidatus Krumholzibacteriia bacterium]
MEILLLIQAAATWALVGLIWTIQVVHYPLFAGVGREGYPAWQRAHMIRITAVVGPLMAVEAAASVFTVVAILRGNRADLLPLAAAALALLAAIWLVTALVQAPIHGRLTAGFDPALHRRLVRTNWLRTLAWTVRGGLVLLMLASPVRAVG